MRSLRTTRRRAVAAVESSPMMSCSPGGRFGRHQVVGAAADRRAGGRASHAPAALSRVRDQNDSVVAGRVGGSVFGPRLRAAILTLTARNRISRRGAAELASEMFGAQLSSRKRGRDLPARLSLLAGPYQQLRDWIRAQDALHVDETGWRTAGDSRALWDRRNPGRVDLRDRRTLQPRAVQPADRRVRRDPRSLTAGQATSTSIPTSGRSAGAHMPARLPPPLRRTRRAEDLRRAGSRPHPPRVRRLARRATRTPRPRPCRSRDRPDPRTDSGSCSKRASPRSQRTRWHRRFANNLLKVWPALWTFSAHPGVEPTNNPAERALRGRSSTGKLSHGTQSHDGERFAERALSAAGDLPQQGRSLFEFLTELLPHTVAAIHSPRSPEPQD